MSTQAERIIALLGERGPVEPVCPEGVRLHVREDGYTSVMVPYRTGGEAAVASVAPDGRTFTLYHIAPEWSPAILRYVADLMEHLTSKHAASDKQRKLDAVKAAVAAEMAASNAKDAAWEAYDKTLAPLGAARAALIAARREAGL